MYAVRLLSLPDSTSRTSGEDDDDDITGRPGSGSVTDPHRRSRRGKSLYRYDREQPPHVAERSMCAFMLPKHVRVKAETLLSERQVIRL